VSINLLPKEMTASKDVSNFSALLKKITLTLGGIFLLVLASGGGFYFLSVNRLNDLKAEYEEAAAQVTNLQSTEASLVFLKDRLQKAQTILASRTSEETFSKQREVLAFAPEEMTFSENRVDQSGSSVEIATKNSLNLVSLMSALVRSSSFSSLVINELSYNSVIGYSLILEVF